MITMVISKHEISCSADGCNRRLRKTYYGKEEDVTENADGSFTIAIDGDPRDADLFITKDTRKVFVCDEDINAWWKQ